MMDQLGATMRILRPHPNVYAFYDGRIEGVRAWSQAPNWLDDGAYALGVASYAIVDGGEALVYDTHISLPHARIIRRTLEEAGVTSIRVVLSHWHDDHVAGNEVFADCEILAHALTARALQDHRHEIETANPPIMPLVMPTATFAADMELTVGAVRVQLRHVDIHSHDGVVLLLPDVGLMLAGDALEEPITYVAEPDRLHHHLADLSRMAGWEVPRILPNHGAEEVIAAGGYGPELIDATIRYVKKLIRTRDDMSLADQDLSTFIAEDIASGALTYFAPYEEVHANNVKKVLKTR